MDLKKLDYKLMIKEIKEYLLEQKDNVFSGESERIIEDIEEIIRSWEED